MWCTEKMGRLRALCPWTAMLIAAVGCGGDDKSPTGPGNQGQGDNPNAIEFRSRRICHLPNLEAFDSAKGCNGYRFHRTKRDAIV